MKFYEGSNLKSPQSEPVHWVCTYKEEEVVVTEKLWFDARIKAAVHFKCEPQEVTCELKK